MKKTKIDLTGELGKPIKRQNPLAVGLLVHDKPEAVREAVYKEHTKIISEKICHRLELLAKELDIDLSRPTAWFEMSVALAQMYIPGFEVVDAETKGPGRPKSVSFELYCEVQGRIGKGHSASAIFQHLSNQDGRWKGENFGSLSTRYYELKREIDNLANNPQEVDPDFERLKKVANASTEISD